MKKYCVWCGQAYETKSHSQKYCCKKCYGVAQKALGYEREYGRMKKKQQEPYHAFKAWDPKDPECQEVARFIRTIRPLYV